MNRNIKSMVNWIKKKIQLKTIGIGTHKKCEPKGKSRFDRFTNRARKVIRLACEEAKIYQQREIKIEHLFQGLIMDGIASDNTATIILKKWTYHQ